MQLQFDKHIEQMPTKRYRIGDLVRYTPFSRQTIHNYTIMGLITEAEWTEGGHRLYDESVFEILSKIIKLKKTKTLYEISRIICKEHSNKKPQSKKQKSDNTTNKNIYHSRSHKPNKTSKQTNL